MITERKLEGSRLRLECASAQAHLADSVLDLFEQFEASGTVLRAGTQLRFGTSLLRLVEDGVALRIAELDCAKWPDQHWLRSIESALDIASAQTSLLKRLGVDAEDAWFDQFIIAAPGALREKEVFLRREASHSSEDSGWLLGTLADPEALSRNENLESVSIAQVVARRFALTQALALPRDFVAAFSGESLQDVFDGSGRALLQAGNVASRGLN